jgi:hypothetical protein
VLRWARADTPGAVHHVMVRGIEKRKIVDGGKYQQAFPARLGMVSAFVAKFLPGFFFAPGPLFRSRGRLLRISSPWETPQSEKSSIYSE